MPKERWVQNVIWGVVFFNTVVICGLFIMPRAQFIMDHIEDSREVLRESVGPLDMPNQYVHTYRVMHQVRDIAGEDAVLLLPADDWEFGSPRSAVIQTLYPRKVYFSGDQGFDEILSQAAGLKEAYVVFNKKWGKEFCLKLSVQDFGEQGFGICRVSK